MKKHIKRIIALVLCISFVVSSMSSNNILAAAHTYGDTKITLLEDSKDKIEVLAEYIGDKNNELINAKTNITIDKKTYNMTAKIIKNNKCVENYKIELKYLQDGKTEYVATNIDTKESYVLAPSGIGVRSITVVAAIAWLTKILLGAGFTAALLSAVVNNGEVIDGDTAIPLDCTAELVEAVNKKKNYQFFEAITQPGNNVFVFIGRPLTREQAVARCDLGLDVMAINQVFAYDLACQLNPTGRPVFDEGDDRPWAYDHYHPHLRLPNCHIYFPQ